MKILVTVLVLSLAVDLSTQQANYCNARLCPKVGPHIACNGLKKLSPSCGSGAREVRLDSSKQALILHLHNELRSKVASGRQNYSRNSYFPQAARMATMQWDTELAGIAAANNRRCVYGHDRCRNTVRFRNAGQNIAAAAYHGHTIAVDQLIRSFISDWYSEYKDATASQIVKFTGGAKNRPIGHFTQVVSDRSIRIGCSLVSYKDGIRIKQNFVCNYAMGNVRNRPVYVTGKACSKCIKGCNKAYPGLCNKNENISARF